MYLVPSPAPSVCPGESHLPSLQNGKIHVGYKDLMENYQIVVSNLAAERGEKDPNLVLNLFQSLLDEFTRGHTKNDFELPKVGGATLSVGRVPAWCGGPPGERVTPGAHTDLPCAPSQQSKAQKKKRKQERAVSMCVHMQVCVLAHAHEHVFFHPVLKKLAVNE